VKDEEKGWMDHGAIAVVGMHVCNVYRKKRRYNTNNITNTMAATGAICLYNNYRATHKQTVNDLIKKTAQHSIPLD
jgi:hypothetical protein